MRSGDLVRVSPSTGRVIPLVVLSGVAVALLANSVPVHWALAAVGLVVFVVAFLHRPDLGLLAVLVVRSFSDLTLGHVAASAPGQILSSPLNVALILILIFAGGFFLLSRGLPIFRLPGGTPFALLMLIGFVGLVHTMGVLHTQSLLSSMQGWLRDMSALAVYALAAHVFQSPRAVQTVIDVLAAAFVMPAAMGFYQLVTRHGVISQGVGIDRITGTFAQNQNLFGIFLVLIFGVFLCQALAHSGTRKFIALSIVATSGVLMVATYARVAWVGTVVVLLVLGILRKRAFLVLVPVIGIIAIGLVPSISHRLADPFGGGSFEDRVGIWRSTVPEWVSETYDDAGAVSTAVNRLIGMGPGSIEFLVQRAFGRVSVEHNDYLRMLLEYGVLGLGAYLWMYFAILIAAYRTWRQCPDERMAAVALSFTALTVSFMVMSLTDNIFGSTQNQVYFWTLAGLTVAISKSSAREEVKSSPRTGNMASAPIVRQPFRLRA
jgi:hypothetical protein